MRKILFSIFILLFAACDGKDDEIFNDEPSADVQAILDKGITIDSITLDYATIYQSIDDFPVIKPNPINQYINKDEVLIYFDFMSNSRESLLEYYSKINEENLKRGVITEYQLNYYDYLEDISVEVKKNNEEFYKIDNDSNAIRIIPTPEINSQYTFAKYEMTVEEFIARYKKSFPDYFVLSFDNKEAEPNSYIFRTTFKFNNGEEFILSTKQIDF